MSQPYDYITIYPFLGHIHVESRVRLEGNRFIGEGRARHYDADGRLTKDTGWEPTGVEGWLAEDRPWWKFW